MYKPPPPYPSNGLASNSTPDLAVASQALNYHRGYINSHVSGSSPDLVSTRTALSRQFLGHLHTGHVNYARVMPGTHGTYNNLASVLDPKPHILIDPHHISDNIQKVYDERGNIMYSMPMHRLPYQRHLVLPQHGSNTQEPIYENVPLPWQNDGKVTVRDRAQSLTTSDEINRINERNSSHPAMDKYTHVQSSMASYAKVENRDNHYVNAQIIKSARETSVPQELNMSNRSINRTDKDFDNVTISVDRLSLQQEEKDYDETPYQSLSTHKVSTVSNDNITSISVPDIRNVSQITQTSVVNSALSNSVQNSSYSTSVELDTSKSSSISGKEKKRRRWGVFMGRAAKTEVKSATLGRDRQKTNVVQPANKHRWSTGLPKFQPLPPSITKETMVSLLQL